MVNRLILIFLVFNTFISKAQDLISTEDFKSTQGIVLVEFWESWNAANECKWITSLNGAETYRMKMKSALSKKLQIKVLPTIALFENGEFIDKWEGDISFTLCKSNKKKIQLAIDELNINNF